ncbi:hypothetical protein GP486_005971 [Trichoglossum hirsutum]|uniref:DUF6594 domain-containing protein n=1 Tax=Trichoglossum hirsutum TaxID=265104 RepID=A0A9P8L873_9PEZI|nr:hypothetical protein GP486_005971 [Trichoglossum hirsutum]
MSKSTDDEIMLDEISPQDMRKKPWKYIGYRKFCEFVTSDNDFFILRRFSELTARVLLALQDELSELESQLQILENHLSQKSAPDVHNGSFRQETQETRLQLICKINMKLRAYSQSAATSMASASANNILDELVIQHSNLRSRPRVPEKDVTSISNWFHNYQNAIWHEETEYTNKPKDLFSIVPKAKTPLRQLLERSSHFRLCKLWRKGPSSEDEDIHFSSDQRIDLFVTLTVTILGSVMLIVPLWLLPFVTRTVQRLEIITAFVVVFLCFVSFAMVARPSESLGATAA